LALYEYSPPMAEIDPATGTGVGERAGPPPPSERSPCVAQYLYVHGADERFYYPSSRSSGRPDRLLARYLECALVQATSLRVNAPSCELVLVTNLTDADSLTRRGRALLDRILELGVELVEAQYHHVPRGSAPLFYSSAYVLDAIDALASRLDAGQQLWMADVDCVWVDPEAAFRALTAAGTIAALPIRYPHDWVVSGRTPAEIGALGARLGTCPPVPDWVGGEVLAGTCAQLGEVPRECERLEAELRSIDIELATEEQLLTLANGLGRLRFASLADTVGRIWTGRRHGAAIPVPPSALAIWHLPSEKGLSLRRAADAILRGRDARLRSDLSDRARAARRFNVDGKRSRALRDDAWLARTRVRELASRKLGAALGMR
jgi:hypothetical protein